MMEQYCNTEQCPIQTVNRIWQGVSYYCQFSPKTSKFESGHRVVKIVLKTNIMYIYGIKSDKMHSFHLKH